MLYAMLASSAVLLVLFTFVTYRAARSMIYATQEIWPATLTVVPTLIYMIGFFSKNPFTLSKLSFIAAPSLLIIFWSLVFQIHPGKFINLLKLFISEFKTWPIYSEIAAITITVLYIESSVPLVAVAVVVAPIGYLVKKRRYRKLFKEA